MKALFIVKKIKFLIMEVVQKRALSKNNHLKKIIIYLSEFTDNLDINEVKKNPLLYKDRIINVWRYCRSKYTKKEDTHCPCGARIYEKCFLRNSENGKEKYVGNVCIMRFGGMIEKVIKVSESLYSGLIGTVIKICCKHAHITLKSKRSSVFMYEEAMIGYFGDLMIYNEDDFIVKTQKNIKLYEKTKYNFCLRMTQHEYKKKCVFSIISAALMACSCVITNGGLMLRM